jgi:Ca2+-binding RTX toxin-like protein
VKLMSDLILASVYSPTEPTETINGYAQNDLGDQFWKALLRVPVDQNPSQFDDSTDPNGTTGSSYKASLTRLGSIQFLVGAVSNADDLPFTATANRTITVPGESVFFFPILNALGPDVLVDENGVPVRNEDGTLAGGIGSPLGPTETEEREVLAALLGDRDLITELRASIDGVSISNLFDYRQASADPFSYYLPKNNILGIPVESGGETFGGVLSDGYWTGIGNLSPENHVIKFGAALEFDANPGPDFVLDITYNISFDLNKIMGTNGKDTDAVRGTKGWDEIYGLNGKDYIVGLEGNDALHGGNGADTLIGTNPHVCKPGKGEIDILDGGLGPDTYVLGDAKRAYYVGEDLRDYALIRGFSNEDVIQLNGDFRYKLDNTLTLGGGSGTGIFLDPNGTNELIGFVEGVTNLSLASNDFVFV